jgi:hypothetical protein
MESAIGAFPHTDSGNDARPAPPIFRRVRIQDV